MIRILFLSLALLAGLVTWMAREMPGVAFPLVSSMDWAKSWLGLTVDEAPLPSVDDEYAPFVSENRSHSSVFRPVHKEYAPALSVPTAHASVIVDAETGDRLYGKNADTRRQIASLTKLMTALIVVEEVKDLTLPVTIDEESVYADGTKVGCPRSGFCNGERLKIGETLTVYDLLQATLMNSANDAAIALGKKIGGSQAGFADRMNTRAQELGLTNSHFCTPSGLEIDGQEERCYSTAADIALVATEALKHDVLWKIMRQETALISSIDGAWSHEIHNTDQLLGEMPNLVGSKTGFTPLAGYSLLAVAKDPTGEHQVVAVVLNDPYRWQSIRSMLDWSFFAFDWI